MTQRKTIACGLAAALALAGLPASGDAPDVKEEQVIPALAPPAVGEPVFGSQLMTQQEMAAHRAAMRAAKTPEEREKIRQAHHQQMVERAKQRGITLPEQPPGPPPGRGMQHGMGMGRGMGMGPPPAPEGEPPPTP